MDVTPMKQPEQPIFTIGYEKSDIKSFIERLSEANIDVLVDVREFPLSRKKGFSKRALREAIESKGISYMHVKELGDPKPGREAARAGNLQLFTKIFTEHMNGDSAQAAINIVAEASQGLRLCLLCFERSHEECHRNIVASRLSEVTGANITHLRV